MWRGPAAAQPPAAAPLAWTDIADLVLASPAILQVRVARASRLDRRAAPDVPAGEMRLLVEADLVAVHKAPAEVVGRARWLWQGPAARGRLPIARGDELVLFATPATAPGGPGAALGPDWRLLNAAGQQRWSEALEASIRAILAEAQAPEAVQAITAVASGFHAAGTIAGESESQFFLETDKGRPIALVVLRRPGAAPKVAVAVGDLIDESAQPVRPQTLLWRALACTAPARLPAALAGDRGLADDWAEVRRQLGPCGRTL